MEPILTGSEERACSFFSEDAGMAEACLVSLVVPSVRSDIVRADQISQTDEIDSLLAFSPWPSALGSKLSALRFIDG